MRDELRFSRYDYTPQELELNKVIAYVQKEVGKLQGSSNDFTHSYDATIRAATDFARRKGITDEQLAFLKFQAEDSSGQSRGVPERLRTWDELYAKASQTISGDVFIEDICSADDFINARNCLDEIDKEFKRKTGLTKTDIAFIVVATALQCVRQYVVQPFLDKHRLTHKQNEKAVGKIIPKSWHDILLCSVPYDATQRLDPTADKTGLGGNSKRYRTLGHDPILGWLFGTANILSDSLTKYDFVTSYEVVNMKIGKMVLTPSILSDAYEQSKEKFNLPIAVVRQALHFGSDYFSTMGLPIPLIGSVNNDVSKYLMNNNVNMLNVTEGAAMSVFINFLISCVHKLFNTDETPPDLYEVRTRKILSISNTIASASNIAVVAFTKKVKLLDLGGLIVTIARLCSDIRFMARVKQEFIEGELDADWEIISKDIDNLCRG